MKLLMESFRKFIAENEENIPSGVMEDIMIYLELTGRNLYDVGIEQSVISASSKTDLEYWLKSKIDAEGEPPDQELMDKICRDGKITTPIIIDTDAEYTVEGRHRLAAALKCGLDVPVVMVFAKDLYSEGQQ